MCEFYSISPPCSLPQLLLTGLPVGLPWDLESRQRAHFPKEKGDARTHTHTPACTSMYTHTAMYMYAHSHIHSHVHACTQSHTHRAIHTPPVHAHTEWQSHFEEMEHDNRGNPPQPQVINDLITLRVIVLCVHEAYRGHWCNCEVIGLHTIRGSLGCGTGKTRALVHLHVRYGRLPTGLSMHHLNSSICQAQPDLDREGLSSLPRGESTPTDPYSFRPSEVLWLIIAADLVNWSHQKGQRGQLILSTTAPHLWSLARTSWPQLF